MKDILELLPVRCVMVIPVYVFRGKFMNIPGSVCKEKVKLSKIESNHNNLRTDEIIGYCWDIPKVGERFLIWEEPKLENVVIREIITTTIQEVDQIYKRIYEFKTHNSTYYLEIL